jgi:hypothetical protein
MKKTLVLFIALTLLCASSCDFIRTLAGRPTTAQVEQMRREQIAAEEARYQARLDSLARAEKTLADSLAAREDHLLDSLSQSNGTILNPAKLGGLFTTKLEAKYYLIVGAFRGRYYAERKLNACKDAGYTNATIISFRNGLMAVGICPSNSLNESVKNLKRLRGTGVCPKDSWILVNE